ncbi:MAG TPA: family 78 glycoside hydrolase catalytic domain [Acidobacteriaceae bacterium]|nr:family 78 glycoside hydrolase catalytic domain [Acidobacteriaceae bacterium]
MSFVSVKQCVACVLVAASSFAIHALPVHLRTEQMTNPLGIDVPKPVFEWQSDSIAPNWMQSAYEVTVASDAGKLLHGDADVWNSGRVAGSDSINIAYGGPALASQRRYFWRVKTWDNHGNSTVSAPAWFETGLLTPADWKAQWIRRDDPAADKELADVRWLWLAGADPRKVPAGTSAEFHYMLHLDARPKLASLQVVAHGPFVARVNGQVTGEHTIWSSFDYEEILKALKFGPGTKGDNDILVKVSAPEVRAPATAGVAFAATIRITGQDGVERRIVSDKSWSARVAGGDWKPAEEVGNISTVFWTGKAVRDEGPATRVSTDVALLRKDFALGSQVRSARLTITAMGAYRAFLNGKAVAPHTLLNPGFTDFNKRVLYQTYDVTSMLVKGQNTIAAMLAGGWHGSPLLWSGIRYFEQPDMLLGQLDITFADGSHKTIATDSTWQTAASPVLSSEIYGGEVYDARLDVPGWNAPGFKGSGWTDAVTGAVPSSVSLTAQPDLSIDNNITLHPIAMAAANAAHPVVFDMGQNMVGDIALHVHGPRGTVVRMRFAERINPDGSIYTANLRNATATDTYTLSGKGEESYTPMFTFHGFRYVELSGYPGTPTTASIDGLVYNSLPAQPSIRFKSSSELLNSMGKLGLWGQRGNFFSIPTDCPQRDERMGWMGDAGVFWRTGTYNFDIASFTHKFMMDIDDAQTKVGAFTDISPDLLQREEGAPGWADAGVLVPYAAWQQYGDTPLLERSWPEMTRYMDFILKSNPDYLRRKKLGANYADWLAPDQNTPKDLIATAYWALVARDMKEMATALHRDSDADKYQQLYDHVAAAYRKAYVHADGSVAGNTQTAYVVTLYAGIAPPDMRATMTGLLVKDIEAHQYHLTTGFLGTPFLMFALDDNQRPDVAYKLLLQDTYPSWGYMVRKGATTWWERWNGDTGDPSMNSYNHYAFGSVMAWVFRRVAGIDSDPSGAGFHHLTIKPHFDAKLPQMHAEYDSTYGTVMTDWSHATGRFEVKIPANTTATVTLPDGRVEQIGSGLHSYAVK